MFLTYIVIYPLQWSDSYRFNTTRVTISHPTVHQNFNMQTLTGKQMESRERKKTEASTLRCTETLHTQINACCLTLKKVKTRKRNSSSLYDTRIGEKLNTLRQKSVHPKDETQRHKKSTVIYAVQCSQDCTDLYIREKKQPLHKGMARTRRANSSGQDTAVHLHLKEKYRSFEDNNVNILSKEDRWFEIGVKESVYVKLEWPSLNRAGGLRLYL